MRLPNHNVMKVQKLSLTLANFGPLQVAWLHAAVLQVLASRELGTMCGSVSSVKAGSVITQSYCRKLLRKVHNILHVQLTKLNVAIVLKGFRIRTILLQMPSGYIVCTNVQMMRPEGGNHVQFRLIPL